MFVAVSLLLVWWSQIGKGQEVWTAPTRLVAVETYQNNQKAILYYFLYANDTCGELLGTALRVCDDYGFGVDVFDGDDHQMMCSTRTGSSMSNSRWFEWMTLFNDVSARRAFPSATTIFTYLLVDLSRMGADTTFTTSLRTTGNVLPRIDGTYGDDLVEIELSVELALVLNSDDSIISGGSERITVCRLVQRANDGHCGGGLLSYNVSCSSDGVSLLFGAEPRKRQSVNDVNIDLLCGTLALLSSSVLAASPLFSMTDVCRNWLIGRWFLIGAGSIGFFFLLSGACFLHYRKRSIRRECCVRTNTDTTQKLF